tara:strand:- start:31964 stop:34354 length:2391 start_codon:yes stop_codon:yes gene_type:complete
MTVTSTPDQLLWLEDIAHQPVGGKALGLQKMLGWQLSVPTGFVLVNAQLGQHPPALADFYQRMGQGKVAVRSSAIGEDGEDSSFAGLYETILNVEGLDALAEAIDACVGSLHSQRASAYQRHEVVDVQQMSVVVQRMVDASAAGVLFTADPVSGRHDRLIIDAVTGLGEALVSGEQTPDHYEYDRADKLVYSELIDDEPILTVAQQQRLIAEARRAVAMAGDQLDMEWAIDKSGQLHWLQARPITTLGTDLNELDTPLNPSDVLTRCNVGEMMPGASCPLTFSTTGRGIEHGMQHMHVSFAGRPAITGEWTQLAMSHGKLFINLTGGLAAAATVLGVDAKSMGHSVCGGIVEELQEPPKKPLWVRIRGALRLLKYLWSADRVIADFRARIAEFTLPTSGDSRSIAAELHRQQTVLYETMAVHLQSSTTSGFASNILQAIISGGQESTAQEEAEAARLMAGATGVESAVLVEQLDAIAEQIAHHEDAPSLFLGKKPAAALAWLTAIQGNTGASYKAFIRRHGHRGYRELCMREVSWGDAPEGLIATLQASVAARLAGSTASVRPQPVDTAGLSPGLRWILPRAHKAVRRRELTKSLLVDVTNRFKQSYRYLGSLLVVERLLEEADLVFFFTEQELTEYVLEQSDDSASVAYWNRKTAQRRLALDYQNRLDFDDINVGQPQPIDSRVLARHGDGEITGRPVSLGIVEATARVAFSVAEAADLKAGEILVAPITDVGWTPYFSMIAGLVTDVGSAVSHGAVIAREYGLPAIVNTRVGTQRIKTGDKIRLDANSGVVTIL